MTGAIFETTIDDSSVTVSQDISNESIVAPFNTGDIGGLAVDCYANRFERGW